jgi:hypothetical protein
LCQVVQVTDFDHVRDLFYIALKVEV